MTESPDGPPPRPARATGLDAGPDALRARAIDVLSKNARTGDVAPARGLYVHQHLWDSCFIAIGQRHFDVEGAMTALRRLVGAQWRNGMVPHIRFERGWRYWWDRRVWRSWVSPTAPPGVATGGISQPPMLAEAVVRVGEVLPRDQRLAWYRDMLPPLLAYHEWLLFDRGLDGRGLAAQVHPWETGLDNSPPLMDRLATRLRWDTKYVPADQRSSTLEALRLYAALVCIRRHRYETGAALRASPVVVHDLTCNSILVRANARLRAIAHELGQALSAHLVTAMSAHERAMEALWDEGDQCDYSRDARSGKLVAEPSIASLMPLYAGCADDARAARLVDMLSDPDAFGPPSPVPSVPLRSRWFQPCRYWQGPTWVNTNWLVIDGLRRYGFDAEAQALRGKTLALVTKSGFSEYYHPLTGAPAGARDFSWTAALVVDLLSED